MYPSVFILDTQDFDLNCRCGYTYQMWLPKIYSFSLVFSPNFFPYSNQISKLSD